MFFLILSLSYLLILVIESYSERKKEILWNTASQHHHELFHKYLKLCYNRTMTSKRWKKWAKVFRASDMECERANYLNLPFNRLEDFAKKWIGKKRPYIITRAG
jgi:hypothetical protein